MGTRNSSVLDFFDEILKLFAEIKDFKSQNTRRYLCVARNRKLGVF